MRKSSGVAHLTLGALLLGLSASACAKEPSPLVLERTISLPNVTGRIDHIDFDPTTRRIAIAELENNSVDVIELDRALPVQRIQSVREPQGLAFALRGHMLAIASRADGALHLIDTNTFVETAVIPLGSDADNVRTDPRNDRAIVGFGDGMFAIVDLDRREVISRLAIPAHPEGFQLDPRTGRIFVNLPDRHTIASIDGTAMTTWRLPLWFYNFPMALDSTSARLASVFRLPSRLALFNRNNGARIASSSTCGDSDDLFFDPPRHHIYVACGSGEVDVYDTASDTLRRVGRVVTRSGARTALFVPELNRLFVAAPARAGRDAEIMVFRAR